MQTPFFTRSARMTFALLAFLTGSAAVVVKTAFAADEHIHAAAKEEAAKAVLPVSKDVERVGDRWDEVVKRLDRIERKIDRSRDDR